MHDFELVMSWKCIEAMWYMKLEWTLEWVSIYGTWMRHKGGGWIVVRYKLVYGINTTDWK